MNYKKIKNNLKKGIENSKAIAISKFLLKDEIKSLDYFNNNILRVEKTLKEKNMFKSYEKNFIKVNRMFNLITRIEEHLINVNESTKQKSIEKNVHLKSFINNVLKSGLKIKHYVQLSELSNDDKLSLEMIKDDKSFKTKRFIIDSLKNEKIKLIKLNKSNNENVFDTEIKNIFTVLNKDFTNKQFIGVLKTDKKEYRLFKSLFEKVKDFIGKNIELKIVCVKNYNVVKSIEIL